MKKSNLLILSFAIATLITSFQNCSSGSLPENALNASNSSVAPPSSLEATGCFLDGAVVPLGTTQTSAFTVSQAPVGQACASPVSYTCASNNSWIVTGSTATSSTLLDIFSQCTANQACTFDGQSMPSGTSAKAYTAASVAYGATCASGTVTCTNGQLSSNASSYPALSCTPAQSPGTWVYSGSPNLFDAIQYPQCAGGAIANTDCTNVGATCYKTPPSGAINLFKCTRR